MLLGESPEDYDKHFILTADIDLDPNLPGRKVFDRAVIAADMAEWSLYFQGTAFTGHLDGQGHTITNLTIDSFGDYIGLFGIIGSGGYVCNIHLVGGRIRGQSFSYKLGGQSIGNVAGENQGSIIGCHCDMSTQGDSSVGGLVGHNMHGTVSNSYSTGSVNGRYSVGGLVGHSGYSSISNSYSAGSVSGLGTVGGLVGGSRDSSISNSYSVALVSGSGVVGGLLEYGRNANPNDLS